jgi:hypothetical protein
MKINQFYKCCTQASVTSLGTGLACTTNGQKSFLSNCGPWKAFHEWENKSVLVTFQEIIQASKYK